MLARQLRATIRAALERKGLKVRDLCEVLGARGDVDERTMWRYFSPKETLARRVAFDLIIRCRRLHIVLPAALVEEVYAEDVTPAIIVFRGEGARLARRLAQEAAKTLWLDERRSNRLERRYAEFLTPYERFNETAVGREVLHRIRSNWRPGTWRQRLHEIRFANVAVDGNSYAIPSPMQLVELAASKKVRK